MSFPPFLLCFKLPGGFNTGELAYGKLLKFMCRLPAVAPRRRDVMVPRMLPRKQPFRARPHFPIPAPHPRPEPTPTRVLPSLGRAPVGYLTRCEG